MPARLGCFVGLVGRVGAVRSSVVGYLIPVVALVLGVVVLGESVAGVQLVGVVVALVGGYVLSRVDPTPPAEPAPPKPSLEPALVDVGKRIPDALHMCR